MATNTTDHLSKLRKLMASNSPSVDAYIVYSEDAHQSEYTPNSDKRRGFISGFTGSAGVAVITQDKAALWTDGRYYLQASQQLDQNWVLMKSTEPGTPTIPEWLNTVLKAPAKVGVDPKLVSIGGFRSVSNVLDRKGNSMVPIYENLVDKVWENKPAVSKNKAFVHDLKFSGTTHLQKIQTIRDLLKKEEVYGTVVSTLDEIAWLFNLRGNDVDFNPVFLSYAIVTQDDVTLYINKEKLTEAELSHLGNTVKIADYEAVFADLKKIAAQNKKMLMDILKCSWALYDCFNEQQKDNVVEKMSLITLPKSLKTKEEIQGLKDSHIRDAAALISFFAWLEHELNAGNKDLTECSVSDKLEEFRSKQKDFVSLSFDTIAGMGPNGAIIHYKPEPSSCAKVTKDSLFLCDSGGQYRDGTTDVTRTLHFGTPTQRQKECFTRVLKGHIALDKVIFPVGTAGRELDILARMFLWQTGLDYRHGTGHGVGAFLNVHEGPQSVSFRDAPVKVPMQVGMTITNEPGYYEDGNFGIRIENVMIVKEAQTQNNFGNRGYLGFEHITLVPIQTKLIDTSLFTKEELEWINSYHKEVLAKVGPLLQGKELEYLQKETQPIHF